MSYFLDDRIAAIASAPGAAEIGIVRVSGPNLLDSLVGIFSADVDTRLEDVIWAQRIPGRLILEEFYSPLPAELYFWPNTRSYTRQPTAEIHTLGSPALLNSILRALSSCGIRVARPGEFTLRAFLAGRLDLPQAEAVLGVIDAQNDRQLHVALDQLAGGLSGRLNQLRNDLLELLAHLEAGLDFVEEDIEFISADALANALLRIVAQLLEIHNRMHSRSRVDTLPRIALIGSPNAGKSSLFNALMNKSEAIVSDIPGTTRDYVTARISLRNMDALLIDTAGFFSDSAADQLDAFAQQASSEQRSQADLELFCIDCSRPLSAWEAIELTRPSSSPRVIIRTKADLRQDPSDSITAYSAEVMFTSTQSGFGVNALRERLSDLLIERESFGDVVGQTSERCSELLQNCANLVNEGIYLVQSNGGQELVAETLRAALDELGQVVGAVYTDDILDRIFSRFCIGK